MIINFNEMESTVIKNFNGGEKDTIAKMYVDGLNRILYGRLEPGASIGLHTHDKGSEIVYIISGYGKAIFDDAEEPLSPGICHYCPKGHCHSLINSGNEDLVFFAAIPQQPDTEK